jgi:hypothetical protein
MSYFRDIRWLAKNTDLTALAFFLVGFSIICVPEKTKDHSALI